MIHGSLALSSIMLDVIVNESFFFKLFYLSWILHGLAEMLVYTNNPALMVQKFKSLELIISI